MGYDLRVAHTTQAHGLPLIDGVENVEVSRIEDECDKLLTTDAPLYMRRPCSRPWLA